MMLTFQTRPTSMTSSAECAKLNDAAAAISMRLHVALACAEEVHHDTFENCQPGANHRIIW